MSVDFNASFSGSAETFGAKMTETPASMTASMKETGGGSASNYEALRNKPKINGHELIGDMTPAQLGITTIPGFSAGNVQTALEQIVQAMQDVTQGSVTDGSITLLKLAAEVTAVALGGAAASHTHGAGDINSGTLDAARLPVLDGTKLGAGSVGTAQLGAAVVTTDKLAALSVLATHIAQGAVTAQKLAQGAVTAEKIAAGAIITALLAPNAVTAEKLANDIPYTKFGLSADQVRHIYTGTSETPPAEWQPGDIYLRYSM